MKFVNAKEVQANFKEYFPDYSFSVSRDSSTIKLGRCSSAKDLVVSFSHLPGSEVHSPGLIWGFGAESDDINMLRVAADSSTELLETALVANELRYFFETVLELKFDKRFSETPNWYLNMIISSAHFGAYMLDTAKTFSQIEDPTDDEIRRGMLAINTLSRHGKSFSRLYEQIVDTFVAETESLANQIVLIYAALAGATTQSEFISHSQTSYSPAWDFDVVAILEPLTEIFHSISFEPNIYGYFIEDREVSCNGLEVTRADSSKASYLNEGGLWAYHQEDSESGELGRIGQIALISESSSLHAMTVFVGIEAMHILETLRSAPKLSKNLKDAEEDFIRARDFISNVVDGKGFVLDSLAHASATMMLARLNEYEI